MMDIPWYVFALLGAFFISLVSVIEKKVLIHENPLHVSGSITLVIGIASLPFLVFIDWTSITPPMAVAMYAISLCATIAFYTTTVSMRGLEAGELSIILALTPAVTAVLAFFFLGESLSGQAVVGIGIISFGLLVLELPGVWKVRHGKGFSKKLMYIAIALFSIGVYAVSAVLDRVVLGSYHLPPMDFLVIVQTLALLNFFLFSLLLPQKEHALTHSLLKEPVKITGISALLFLSRLMYSYSVSLAFVALAAVLKRTGALFTVVLARSYLHEHGLGHKILAASIILIGVAAIVL